MFHTHQLLKLLLHIASGRPRKFAIMNMADKTDRRAERTRATKLFNTLASEFELELLKSRPSAEDVVKLFERLAGKMPAERQTEIADARDVWVANGGGGDFPDVLGDSGQEAGGWEIPGTVFSHSSMVRPSVQC